MMKWGECGSEFLILHGFKKSGKTPVGIKSDIPSRNSPFESKPTKIKRWSNSSGFGFSKPLVCWLRADETLV